MTTFFEVKGNVKFNGVEYKKDTIVSGEVSEFQSLVNDGLFFVLEDAETLEQAQEIVESSKKTIEDEEIEVPPENTWGPKPDKEEEETPSTEEEDEEESEEGDEVDTSNEDEEESLSDDDDDELS